MLATGGSALVAVEKLLEAGVSEEKIIFVNIVSSPEGITNVLSKHPKLHLCTASIAEGLTEKTRYLRKSLGDFGDRVRVHCGSGTHSFLVLICHGAGLCTDWFILFP